MSIVAFSREFAPPEMLNAISSPMIMDPMKSNIYSVGLLFASLLKSATNEQLRAVLENRKTVEKHKLFVESVFNLEELKTRYSNGGDDIGKIKVTLESMINFDSKQRPTAKQLYAFLHCSNNLNDILTKSECEIDQIIIACLTGVMSKQAQNTINTDINEIYRANSEMTKHLKLFEEGFNNVMERLRKLEDSKEKVSFSFGDKSMASIVENVGPIESVPEISKKSEVKKMAAEIGENAIGMLASKEDESKSTKK